MKPLLTVCLATFVSFFPAMLYAADGDEAMFGLRWGMSIAEVRSLGTTLTKSKGDRNLETYSATSLPKNVSDIENYSLIFASGKLVKIIAVGKDIANDPSGSTGKDRFESISSALTDKYGKATTNYQSIGNRLFKEYDEFYQCLAYSGCGMWVSLFKSPDKTIAVELKGLRRATGYLVITAESSPQWSEALEAYKSKKNSSDKDAL